MKKWIFWKMSLIKVVQRPQKSLKGSNQIWPMTSGNKNMYQCPPGKTSQIVDKRLKVLVSSNQSLIKNIFCLMIFSLINSGQRTEKGVLGEHSYILILIKSCIIYVHCTYLLLNISNSSLTDFGFEFWKWKLKGCKRDHWWVHHFRSLRNLTTFSKSH